MITSAFKKNTSLLLALLLTLMSVSCGSAAEPDTETTDSTTTAPEETTDNDPRKNAKDDLPELDFKGSTIRVLSRGGDYDTKIEFNVEEATGEIVEDAVFNRNKSVEERLNVVI